MLKAFEEAYESSSAAEATREWRNTLIPLPLRSSSPPRRAQESYLSATKVDYMFMLLQTRATFLHYKTFYEMRFVEQWSTGKFTMAWEPRLTYASCLPRRRDPFSSISPYVAHSQLQPFYSSPWYEERRPTMNLDQTRCLTSRPVLPCTTPTSD